VALTNIDLVVVGLGEGTYKKLYPAIELVRSQGIDLRIAYGIDVRGVEDLHPAMRRIMQEHDTRFVSAHIPRGWRVLKTLKPSNTAVMIMTPNDSHIEYGWEFAERGFRVLIEKPPGIGPSALDEFLKLAGTHPQRIYSGEYCVDGKALGLLHASGMIPANDPRTKYLTVSPSGLVQGQITNVFRSLGRLRSVNGKLLEGQGTAAKADHRAWLFDGRQGGMVRDLSSHLFGPIYDAGLVTASVVDPKVQLGIYCPGDELGTYRPLENVQQGEMYAKIEGSFTAPDGRSIPFVLEVGKYQSAHNRLLQMEFENGVVTLDYELPFTCRIKPKQGPEVSLEVHLDHYALCLIDFVRNFLDRRKGVADPGHLRRGAAIVSFNETMRLTGLRQLGLA